VVFVDESAEEVAALDRLGSHRVGVVSRLWWVEFECSVWPFAVVVLGVDAERMFEVAAANNEQPVGDGANPVVAECGTATGRNDDQSARTMSR
jgi:hypothetical protein